jgi:hypothetical protein
MANTILTDEVIAKEALMLLDNNLVFAKGANRKYEKTFEGERKVGDTISIKLPSQYTVRSGATASIQDNVQDSVSLVVDSQKGIDVEFTSKELAMDLQDFSKEVLAPQIARLANEIDKDGLALYKHVPNVVQGTLANFDTYLTAGAILDENGCPMDDERSLILAPRSQLQAVNGFKGLFQSSEEISKQYKKGRMGIAAGFDWAPSQTVATHTVGALGGTPLVNDTLASGDSTVTTDGWTAAAANRLKQGDVITFAGCYNVNPMTKQSTGVLKQFVVTADVASDGSGNADIPISPAMISTGAKQNCSALPADNAAITVVGSASTGYSANLAYHKDAFALAMVDLPLPKGMDMAARASSSKVGASIRFVRGYDITNDKFISRLDVLYGWKCVRPELACRIQGT